MKKGKLVIISGPSAGVGKDTILRMFLDKHKDWRNLPSITTRPARAGEVEGKDYIFVDRNTFESQIKKSEFLEWEETTNNLYGTPKSPVTEALRNGHNLIMRKDVRGALSIKKALPDAITICLLPDEWEALERRFRDRATDSEELILARLALAKEELKYKDDFDHIIINPHNRAHEALALVEKAIGV